jgi:hypothetical protein
MFIYYIPKIFLQYFSPQLQLENHRLLEINTVAKKVLTYLQRAISIVTTAIIQDKCRLH